MAIDLPPQDRMLISSGRPRQLPAPQVSAANGQEAAKRQSQQPKTTAGTLPKVQAAPENYLPSDQSLATLVENAKFAKRQGAIWDRGSMVNLLV